MSNASQGSLVLYYCGNNDVKCIWPLAETDVIWGCKASKECVQPAPENTPAYCNIHRGFPLIRKCPVCNGIVEYGAQPISYCSAPAAGKTVFQAAQAKILLSPEAMERYGIDAVPIFTSQGQEYRKKVVNPLFDKGVLPKKTQVGDINRAVFRISTTSRESAVIQLTDLPGEAFGPSAPAVKVPNRGNMRLISLLHCSKKFMFLFNLNDNDALGALSTVLNLLEKRQFIREDVDEQEMSNFFQKMDKTFKKHWWPNVLSWNGLVDDIRHSFRYYQYLFSRSLFDSNGFYGKFQNSLKDIANQQKKREEYMLEFNEITEFLRPPAEPGVGNGKLDYTVAIVLSKADQLMPDHKADWNKIQKREPKNRKSSNWKRYLELLSNEFRNQLLDMGEKERHLVKVAENRYKKVGFFFTSALGRDTQVWAKCIHDDDQPSFESPSDDYSGGAVEVEDFQKGERDRANSSIQKWELEKKVQREAGRDLAEPTPRGVMLPLLWLLFNG